MTKLEDMFENDLAKYKTKEAKPTSAIIEGDTSV